MDEPRSKVSAGMAFFTAAALAGALVVVAEAEAEALDDDDDAATVAELLADEVELDKLADAVELGEEETAWSNFWMM